MSITLTAQEPPLKKLRTEEDDISVSDDEILPAYDDEASDPACDGVVREESDSNDSNDSNSDNESEPKGDDDYNPSQHSISANSLDHDLSQQSTRSNEHEEEEKKESETQTRNRQDIPKKYFLYIVWDPNTQYYKLGHSGVSEELFIQRYHTHKAEFFYKRYETCSTI